MNIKVSFYVSKERHALKDNYPHFIWVYVINFRQGFRDTYYFRLYNKLRKPRFVIGFRFWTNPWRLHALSHDLRNPFSKQNFRNRNEWNTVHIQHTYLNLYGINPCYLVNYFLRFHFYITNNVARDKMPHFNIQFSHLIK